MTDTEKAKVQKLLEMLDAVNAEGMKTINELRSDIQKELVKNLIP